jgi:hypothetical protein
MKKIFAILLVFVVFSSCKKLEDLNKDIKSPTTSTGESIFPEAQKNLFNQMVTTNVNRNIWRLIDQYWTETTYPDESNYNIVNRSIPDSHWDALYVGVLKNLSAAKNFIAGSTTIDPNKANKLAVVDVLSVYAWSILVETFGDIPYSQALDINNLSPKYDDGYTVYKDLINRLNHDIATMDPSLGSFDAADNMYQGDVTLWTKFANSLRLRMGMLLADKDPAFAKTTVEAATADLSTLIQDNSENALLHYQSSAPNDNPMYEDQVASYRHDFVAAHTIVEAMSNLNDPRLFTYFSKPMPFPYKKINGANHDSVVNTGLSRVFIFLSSDGTFDSTVYKQPPYTILASDSSDLKFYYGAPIGIKNTYSTFSHSNTAMWDPTYPGLIMDYAEVEFLLAEAVSRGYTVGGGTAPSHFALGITASIEYWGGSATDATAYLANPLVAFDAANWKKSIGMQQWIAYYNRGLEGWTALRRLDYPVLIPGPHALSPFPVRFTYPIAEQTLNGASYGAAAAAIGGDAVTTKLFWDKY